MLQCSHRFHNYDKVVTDETHRQEWIWFGAHWHEIGFVACVIQLVAATVFWIATITGIQGVINMNIIPLVDGIFWVPQVIGGTGFIISRYIHYPMDKSLTAVFFLCLKLSQNGIGSVLFVPLAGMSDSGI